MSQYKNAKPRVLSCMQGFESVFDDQKKIPNVSSK
jgi:hypothetical protein